MNQQNVKAVIDAAAITDPSQSAAHIIIRTTGGGAGADRFAFGFTRPEDYSRRVFKGPILSGPYLYGFGVSTCIHNGPVTANAPELHLEDGDIIEIRNLVERGHLRSFRFKLTVNRGYPKFECIDGRQSLGHRRNIKLDIRCIEISKEEYSEHRAVNA